MMFQFKCPFCDRRLFDVEENATALIEIKCLLCKQLVKCILDKSINKSPEAPTLVY